MKKPAVPAALFASLIATVMLPADEGFETPPEFAAGDLLEPALLAGDHFKVDPVVRNGGYLNHFVIHTDYGDFTAAGRTMLEIRLGEVAALTRIADISKTDVFLRAAKNAAVDVVVQPVKAATGIVSDPVGTVTRLPRGIGRLFSRYAEEGREVAGSVSDAATDLVSGGSNDSTVNDLADSGRGAAKSVLSINSAERRWAKQLGTDPYTSNNVLRKAIEDIAWFDGIGRLAPALAGVPSIPGAGELVRVNELAWEDPRTVRAKNRERLVAMKLPEADIDAFLEKSAFTPTHQLVLLELLDALDGVAGREVLLRQAMDKKSEAEIWFHLDSVRLLVALLRDGAPIERILPGSKLTVAATSDGRLLTALGLDTLVWTEDIDRIALKFIAFTETLPHTTSEIWITGTASERAKAEISTLGLELHEMPRDGLKAR